MSTRSVIAERQGDGWRGVYHHSDGYPHGLGCYIFRLIRQKYKGNVRTFLDYALGHDGGWSHIFPGRLLVAGKGGRDHYSEREAFQCFCHGYFARRDKVKPGQGGGVQTHDKHGFDIEWVYVLDPEAKTMAVIKHAASDSCPDRPSLSRGVRHGPDFGLKAVVNLDGEEPDWWAMEGKNPADDPRYGQTWVDSHLPRAA